MEFLNEYRNRLKRFGYNSRALLSGSFSEIPAVYFFSKPTDIDFILYLDNLCAVPNDAQAPSDFRGQVLTSDSQGLPAGYVTLKNSRNECYKHLQTYDYDNPHGPALRTPAGWSTLTLDMVYSVQSPYWPSEAQEWITRKRSHGWPSKDLIDQIVNEGCFLVGKSHPNCKDDDDTQGRYSFSKAEISLISSWSDSQMYVYHVLRMIKSEFVKYAADETKTAICTYHLKTQMFWACEERPAEFWEDNNLMTSICILLTEIEKHLIDRRLPNYFLPECNIVEGVLIENNFSEALRMLNTQLDRSILKPMLRPKVCHECRISASLPVNMAPFSHLLAERFGLPFQARRSKHEKVQELINEELEELMKGIYYMQLARTPGDCFYKTAEQHFSNGLTNDETVNRKRVELSISASLNLFRATYESLENAELSTLEEGKNPWDISATIVCTKEQCVYAGTSFNLPWTEEKHGKFYEKWMNPTHLLSAAYLSNLYFITGQYDLCIKIVGEQTAMAINAFNAELFPMIFCPELASLFDDNLQQVLALLWLCIRVSGGKRIFEFSTCPYLFMLYIGIQCSSRLRDNNLETYKYAFNEHSMASCKYHFYLYPHHYVLFDTAWHISERRRF